MRRSLVRLIALIFPLGAALGVVGCQGCNVTHTNVATQHNNNSRNGANVLETSLTPANVQSSRFGLLYEREFQAQPVAGSGTYAQPLYIHGVPTLGGPKNLFFIATESNWLYAFDADDLSVAADPIFRRQIEPSGPSSVCAETPSGVVGITGTPVIDEIANAMFVVARSATDHQYYLHKLDITNNFRDLAAPVVMGGTDPASKVAFVAACHRQRPGLLLNNGIIYAGFASFSCDRCSTALTDRRVTANEKYHGWILGYKASDLTPAAIFCTSCGTSEGTAGIWQTGGGLVSDNENIYFETGNGGHQLGDSFVKLHILPSWPGLSLAGHYTPVNAAALDATDSDLGSGGPVLIAGGLLVGGGKQGRYYVINTSNMTLAQDPAPLRWGFDGFQAFENTYHNDPTQTVCTYNVSLGDCRATPGSSCYVDPSKYGSGEICGPNIHGTPVFWQFANSEFGYIYQMPEKDYVKAFQYNNAAQHVQETAAVTGLVRPPDGMPGGASSLSAAFGNNGILWASWPLGDAQANFSAGSIAAFDALTLRELWRDDSAGYIFAKSVPPTIADGKVIRATGTGTVLVYGLRSFAPWFIKHPPILTGAPAINEVFKRSGGERGLLGTPLSDPKPIAGGGWSQDFKSNLYLRTYTAASVHPNPMAMAMSCGRPFPPGSQTPVESSVYWSSRSGAHIVTGEIRQFWLKQGGPSGSLGYPVSDEMPSPDESGRASQFEHGQVIWHFDKSPSISKKP